MQELMLHIDQVRSLCQAANVKTLFAFGSVVKDRLDPESDIDLVVDIEEEDPEAYSDHYFNLKFKLQELLKRPIDLLEQGALRNPFLRAEIDRTKVLVYGK